MQKLKGIFLSLLAVSPIAVSLSVVSVSTANAQAGGQTLAQCVKELNDVYPSYVGTNVFKTHTQNCLDNLATQPPTESLGQCVARMNKIYPSYVGSEVMATHTQTCNNLLRAQRANANKQIQPPQNGTVYIVPGTPRPSPQEFASCVNAQMYRQKQVCIDPWGDIDKTCFYRGRGGRKTVSEATGVSIDQARAICGG